MVVLLVVAGLLVVRLMVEWSGMVLLMVMSMTGMMSGGVNESIVRGVVFS